MKRQRVYVLGFVGFLVVLTTAWAMTSRVGYESADYQLIESDGNIEIRKYPVLVLAATTSDLDSQGRDGSFMRLFRYISGDNVSRAAGGEGKEWERDTEMKYVVQSGPLKNVAVRLRNATFRSNLARDADEVRLLVSYSVALW